ncbi:MAG: ATP-binding protein, partial [Candidatus Competibacteraceae bacterium]
MEANHCAAPALPRASAKGEVAGSFLIGLTQAFYNLSVLPQGGMALKIDTIDAAQWYPYSMLIDTFHAIEKTFPSSRILSVRAGMNFIRVWYEHGPGKTMIHSTLDWLHAHDEGAGYNSVARGGSKSEIGWSRMLSIDETNGIAVYESVMPLSVDFVTGVFYGGCFLFDDMEYVAIEGTSEPYAPNPSFNRLVHTVRFRQKPKDTCQDLDRRIDDLQLGCALSLTLAEVESLVWRYKGLRRRHAVDTEYYNEINTILANAITESRRIAKELELAKVAAEAANLAKSAFLASVSHELRTPLNAILGFSELLRRDADIVGRDREHLDIIKRSGAHLLGLINDILDMAKIEAGHVQLQMAPLDLHTLVRDLVSMMRQRALEKGLELRLEQSSRVVRYIKGDETRLRQVLVNLLGNAIKFTEKGLVTLRLEAQPDPNQSRLLIEVEDTGPGIAPEDQARVFEPFVQAGLTAGQKGSGLGLAITRQFVELMGGRIGVSSRLGQGSRFWIDLPV